jgi:aerobic-type carbon monoxide dehydrogenase small subunit (CoxS/CutS family)
VIVEVIVDGIRQSTPIDPGESLMDLLRRLGHKSVKNGCDNGDCGACSVLLDGRAVNACLVFAAKAHGRSVRTAESLASHGVLHPLQRTFLDLGAVQCGFCTPGMLVLAADLVARNPHPTEAEVREALQGNFCRCTGYLKPVEAILSAAAEMREAPQ